MSTFSISKNSFAGLEPPKPEVSGKSNLTVRFTHKEFLVNVITSSTAGAFNVRGIPINPAQSSTFPWLSSIANQYQMWRPLGIAFEFKSTSGEQIGTSGNTALGTVIMSTQYNTNQQFPASKKAMENTQYSSSCKPSTNMVHLIECSPDLMVLPRLYVSNKNLQNNLANDLRFNNLGSFYLGTQGFQGTSVNCGELWISYDIELSYPIENSNSALFGDHYDLTPNISSLSTSNYFEFVNKQSVPDTTDSNLGTVLNATQIIFPAGSNLQVMVFYHLIGASTALQNPNITGTNGATALNLVTSDTTNLNSANSTSTEMNYWSFWDIIDQGTGLLPTLTFSMGTLPTSLTAGDLFIFSIQNGE